MWDFDTLYAKFEDITSRLIIVFLAIAIVAAIVFAGINLVSDIIGGKGGMEGDLFQDAFGSVLTILILLEFNHSIVTSLARRSGIIQARIIVLLAIIVVARKIILVDFTNAKIEKLAGLAGLVVALGVLHWLISNGGARKRLGGARGNGKDAAEPAPAEE